MDDPVEILEPKVVVLRKRNIPLLIVVILLSIASIGGTGLYTGQMIGQHRSDSLLTDQRQDYENRLINADKSHQAELTRVAAETAALSLALSSLDKRVKASAEVAASGAATASAALAIANNAVAAHHDVTRAEFTALSAKTRSAQADAKHSGQVASAMHDVAVAEHQELASAVQANTVQTKVLDAKIKKIEQPPATSWWGGKKN